MTLAAIDWLSISINLLLIVFVIVCLLMTLLILMQRPKQEGLGAAFGGGVTDQVFGASTTNVLQKGTVWLGSLFFVLSLLLAVLVGQQNKQKSVKGENKPPAQEAKAEVELPAVQPESLREELAVEPTEGSAPVETPAAPQEAAPAEAPAVVPTPAEVPAAPEAPAEIKEEKPKEP
jgi:preprotein translocase subunit SecG